MVGRACMSSMITRPPGRTHDAPSRPSRRPARIWCSELRDTPRRPRPSPEGGSCPIAADVVAVRRGGPRRASRPSDRRRGRAPLPASPASTIPGPQAASSTRSPGRGATNSSSRRSRAGSRCRGLRAKAPCLPSEPLQGLRAVILGHPIPRAWRGHSIRRSGPGRRERPRAPAGAACGDLDHSVRTGRARAPRRPRHVRIDRVHGHTAIRPGAAR